MYSLSSLRTALSQPRLAVGEINRLVREGAAGRSSPSNEAQGLDILAEDWDTLIVLDACRFDTFAQRSSELDGELTRVQSKASATTQFLRANFSGRQLHDTIYVTANPQLYRIQDGSDGAPPIDVSFYKQVEVWQDSWHEQHGTVLPEAVTDAALEVAREHPNKKYIVHYLQPHAPFVGPTGLAEIPTEYTGLWGRFRDGTVDVSLDTAKQAYRENLDLVLPHVATLLSEIDGKTVVTADHGELLGERDRPIPIRRFGHPAYTPLPALVDVPWLVHESGPRPEIVAETPGERTETHDSDVVTDRLKDLGYR